MESKASTCQLLQSTFPIWQTHNSSASKCHGWSTYPTPNLPPPRNKRLIRVCIQAYIRETNAFRSSQNKKGLRFAAERGQVDCRHPRLRSQTLHQKLQEESFLLNARQLPVCFRWGKNLGHQTRKTTGTKPKTMIANKVFKLDMFRKLATKNEEVYCTTTEFVTIRLRLSRSSSSSISILFHTQLNLNHRSIWKVPCFL